MGLEPYSQRQECSVRLDVQSSPKRPVQWSFYQVRESLQFDLYPFVSPTPLKFQCNDFGLVFHTCPLMKVKLGD